MPNPTLQWNTHSWQLPNRATKALSVRGYDKRPPSCAVCHQRFLMVCLLQYRMPHEPVPDLSHQSSMGVGFFMGNMPFFFFQPLWEWWLDPSQPAIDGLVLNWDDWVVLLSMHGSKALWAATRVCACSLSMHAGFCEQQHICATPSPLSLEFWVSSIITNAVVLTAWLAGCWVERHSSE